MVRSQILPRREPLALQDQPVVEKWWTRKVYRIFNAPQAHPVSQSVEETPTGRQPIVIRLPPRDKWPVRLLWAVLGLQTALFVTEIARLVLTWH